MGDDDQRPVVLLQRALDGLDALEVQMVGGLVQQEEERRIGGEEARGHRSSEHFPATERGDRAQGVVAAEEERRERLPSECR